MVDDVCLAYAHLFILVLGDLGDWHLSWVKSGDQAAYGGPPTLSCLVGLLYALLFTLGLGCCCILHSSSPLRVKKLSHGSHPSTNI